MPTLVPVDHDPFADAAPAPTPGVRFVPVDHDPFAESSVAGDVAKQLPSGVAEGAVGLATSPVSLPRFLSHTLVDGADYLGRKALGLPPRSEADAAAEAQARQEMPSIGVDRLAGAANKAAHDALPEPETTAGKYARSIGEFVPNLALGPGGVARRAAQDVIVPGAAAEFAGEKAQGTKYEPFVRAGAAFAGNRAAAGATRVATPLPIAPERQALVDTLDQADIPLTAGQRTGNKLLRRTEDALSSMPGAGKGAQAIDEAQKAAYTREVLRGIGLDASNASTDALASAKKALSDGFESVSKRNTVNLDHAFANDIGDVLNKYDSMTVPGMGKPIVQQMNDGLAQLGGALPGDRYQSMRSFADKAARARKDADPDLSEALFGFRNALDRAMERSVSPADAAEWADLRNKWKNWKVVEKTANRAGEEAQGGNISPANLRSAASAQNRGDYAVGRGDYGDLARAGEAIMTPLKSSGTAERSNMMHVLSTLGAGVGGLLGGPLGFSAGGLAPIVGPAAAGRVLMSRPIQAYLSNQRFANVGQPSVLDQLLLMDTGAADAISGRGSGR